MYHPDGGYHGDDTCSSVCSSNWKESKGSDDRVLYTCDCTSAWIDTKGVAICACIW